MVEGKETGEGREKVDDLITHKKKVLIKNKYILLYKDLEIVIVQVETTLQRFNKCGMMKLKRNIYLKVKKERA